MIFHFGVATNFLEGYIFWGRNFLKGYKFHGGVHIWVVKISFYNLPASVCTLRVQIPEGYEQLHGVHILAHSQLRGGPVQLRTSM